MLGWIGGGIVHVAGGIVVALLSYVKTGALTLPTPYTILLYYCIPLPLLVRYHPYAFYVTPTRTPLSTRSGMLPRKLLPPCWHHAAPLMTREAPLTMFIWAP